jgi:hypothetical protein
VPWRRVPAGGSWPDFFVDVREQALQFLQNDHKMQMCRIIYCSLIALHVSSDIFAHHQEHLNCNYSFWFYSRAFLSAADSSPQRRT